MAAFDTERFIVEIENRPSLWNISSDDYSNRDLKKKCWEEIVDIFKDKEEMNIQEKKKELGKCCIFLLNLLMYTFVLPW